MSPLAIEIKSLSFSYGSRAALRDVNFSVESGASFAVVGPNGGGKSTTFKLLSTLLPAPRGTIRLFGKDPVDEAAAVRNHLGVVFQNSAVDVKLSLSENLRCHGNLYGIRGRSLASRSETLLKALSLWDRRDEKVESLSGGLKRRLELAKALLPKPTLLLMDEPTTGLDPLGRREFWNYLRALRSEEKTTLVFTTHLLNEAEGADQLVLLHQGKVVAWGAPADLRASIGGDVISIRSLDSASLKTALEKEFHIPASVVGDEVRVERSRAHEFIPSLVTAFSDQIQSVTVGKPTLEDVFIQKTGHRLEGAVSVSEGI